MLKPVAVEPREGFRIWIRYEDGAEGEIDLSHLVGKGVFKAWGDRDFFESVYIADRAVMWGDKIDLCPDALYMRLTGVSLEEYREISKLQATNA